MITVTGPDGSTHSFPEGTDPNVIRNAMARHYAGPVLGGHGVSQDFAPANSPPSRAQVVPWNQAFPSAPVATARSGAVVPIQLPPSNPHPQARAQPSHPQSEDLPRSLAGGLAQGLTAAAAPFGGLRDLGNTAQDWMSQEAENVGLLPRGTNADIRKAGFAPHEYWGAMFDPAGYADHQQRQAIAEATARSFGANPTLAHAAASAFAAPASPIPGLPAWSPGDVRGLEQGMAEQVGGPSLSRDVADVADYQPQTAFGRAVHTAATFAPAAIAPGSAWQRLAMVAGPTAGSEIAGEGVRFLRHPEWEPAARFFGSAAGGLTGAGLTGPSATTRSLGELASNMSPEQLEQTRGLLSDADRFGINMPTPVAADYVTNGATSGSRDLQFIESTRRGQRAFAPYFAQLPGQMRDAAFGVFDQVAPAIESPDALGLRTQDAAQGVLDLARRRVNESAGPIYARLPGQTMPGYNIDASTGLPTPGYNALSANDAYAQALREFRGDPILNNREAFPGGPTYSSLPDNDLAVVNEASKKAGRLNTANRQTETNSKGDNTVAAEFGKAKDMADALAGQTSPDYSLARETVATGNRAFVDPLSNGPMGRLAVIDQQNPQFRALYPNAPGEGTAANTELALNLLKLKDPTVGPALTRQYLASTYDAAAPEIGMGGVADQWGGARFARNVAGSQFDRDTLNAGVGAAAPQASGDLSDLIDVLAATGVRRAPSRGEVPMMQDQTFWSNPTNAADVVMNAASNPGGVLEHGLGGWLNRQRMNWNANRYFDATTSGDADTKVQTLLDALRAYDPQVPLTVRPLVLGAPQPQDQGGPNAP